MIHLRPWLGQHAARCEVFGIGHRRYTEGRTLDQVKTWIIEKAYCRCGGYKEAKERETADSKVEIIYVREDQREGFKPKVEDSIYLVRLSTFQGVIRMSTLTDKAKVYVREHEHRLFSQNERPQECFFKDGTDGCPFSLLLSH